jgi:hypothetical protein
MLGQGRAGALVFGGCLFWCCVTSPTCLKAVCAAVVVVVVVVVGANDAATGESKRLVVVESPWSQLTSQCQRF